MQSDVRKKKARMLVDRLTYHMTLNAIQNGGVQMFFPDRYYTEENDLFAFLSSTPEWRECQLIVRHWLKKMDKEHDKQTSEA